jgi:hypothetical protein
VNVNDAWTLSVTSIFYFRFAEGRQKMIVLFRPYIPTKSSIPDSCFEKSNLDMLRDFVLFLNQSVPNSRDVKKHWKDP